MGIKPNNKIQLLNKNCFWGHSSMLRPAKSTGAVILTRGLSSAFTPSMVSVARISSAGTGRSLEKVKVGTCQSCDNQRWQHRRAERNVANRAQPVAR